MTLNVLFASGFFILVFATFCIDHFQLHGLSQAFNFDISAALRLSAPSKSDGATQLRVFVPRLAHNSRPRSHLQARPLRSCSAPHHDRLLAWYRPLPACLILPLLTALSCSILGISHYEWLQTPHGCFQHNLPCVCCQISGRYFRCLLAPLVLNHGLQSHASKKHTARLIPSISLLQLVSQSSFLKNILQTPPCTS